MSEYTGIQQASTVAEVQETERSAPNLDSLLYHLRGHVHLAEPLQDLRLRYSQAKPFPHIVIDDMFPEDVLDRILAEVPVVNRDNFIQHHDHHQTKFGLRSAVSLKHEGYRFASFLHSAAFLCLLSEITGVWGLLPDPYMQGGGFHIVPSGGKFDVHLDRKTDYSTGLRRRLAFITYLNRDWKPEYGGELELWDNTGTRCEASVYPLFNRTIIFEIADGNYHGHPNPVAAPDGRPRRSFAVYYHTVGDGEHDIDMRSSIFAPAFTTTPMQRLRRLAGELTPPMLARMWAGRRMKA